MSNHTPAPRAKALIVFVVAVGLACVLQFVYMVVRLANLSDFPPDQWGQVQLTTNLHVLIAAIGLICLYNIWIGEHTMIYAFYGLTIVNIGLALYGGNGLIALVSGVAALVLAVGQRIGWWKHV